MRLFFLLYDTGLKKLVISIDAETVRDDWKWFLYFALSGEDSIDILSND